MNAPAELLDTMFDAASFRTTGHALVDLLSQQLQQNLNAEQAVLQWREPALADQDWQQPLPEQPTLNLSGLLSRLQQDILPASLGIHHPHNMGHQVATPLPIAALCDLVAALTNQAMATYETGPSATMLERQVIRWLSALIGWQTEDVNGVLTSGGTQANLTALLAARQHADESADFWRHGLGWAGELRILASELSHYSITRAAGIMGLGTDAVIKIATDRAGAMLPEAVARAHRSCIERQQTIIAVVANAACTPTGSVDPLRAIGEYCQAHRLWFHVDGAHGASALLSAQHQQQLDGIALADSIVWDGHKLLYMPAAVSAALFRQAQHSYLAFAQQASYLFQSDDHARETFNVSYRSLECTKRMMALKLWAAFSLYGVRGLAVLIDQVFASAREFATMLVAHPDFELLTQPQTNIVCFRHRKSGLAEPALSVHQARLRAQIVSSGKFHLTQVELKGRLWLRTTLMNPYTRKQHLQALLDCICQTSD